jgi:hypothetical protein
MQAFDYPLKEFGLLPGGLVADGWNGNERSRGASWLETGRGALQLDETRQQ